MVCAQTDAALAGRHAAKRQRTGKSPSPDGRLGIAGHKSGTGALPAGACVRVCVCVCVCVCMRRGACLLLAEARILCGVCLSLLPWLRVRAFCFRAKN